MIFFFMLIEISNELFLTCEAMEKKITLSLRKSDDVYLSLPNFSRRLRAVNVKVLRKMTENNDASKNKEVTLAFK